SIGFGDCTTLQFIAFCPPSGRSYIPFCPSAIEAVVIGPHKLRITGTPSKNKSTIKNISFL
ncbi:MAG: hypothetical protein ACJ795_16520, partial [Ktedonobacteraceae bacterium]